MQRILIIDDHPIFRHAMVTILGKKFPDSQTIEANSLSEALEVLEADAAFDLVMLDLNMPETDAYSKELRTAKYRGIES